jgi:AcrR family transcriptional regulator
VGAPLPAERLDPRVVRSRDRVLAAAVELLLEHGAAALTMEGVAARSGVAKSTIYRQFDSREAIHAAAIESIVETIEFEPTGKLIDDVTTSLCGLAQKLRSGEFAALLATAIDAGERSNTFAAMSAASCRAKRSWVVQRLAQANRNGEFVERQEPEFLAALLAGPIFYRRLLSHEPIPKRFVAHLVRAVLGPLLTVDAARAVGP